MLQHSLTGRDADDSAGDSFFRARWGCAPAGRAAPPANRLSMPCVCRLGQTPTSLLYLSLERRRAVPPQGRLGPHGAPTGQLVQAPHRGNPGVGSRIRIVVFWRLRRGFSVWDRRLPPEARHFPGFLLNARPLDCPLTTIDGGVLEDPEEVFRRLSGIEFADIEKIIRRAAHVPNVEYARDSLRLDCQPSLVIEEPEDRRRRRIRRRGRACPAACCGPRTTSPSAGRQRSFRSEEVPRIAPGA